MSVFGMIYNVINRDREEQRAEHRSPGFVIKNLQEARKAVMGTMRGSGRPTEETYRMIADYERKGVRIDLTDVDIVEFERNVARYRDGGVAPRKFFDFNAGAAGPQEDAAAQMREPGGF